MSEVAVVIDASGLKCPLPVLKARKAIKSLEPGQELEVISTDPAAPLDFKHFSNTSGHELVAIEQDGDRSVVRLRKAGPA